MKKKIFIISWLALLLALAVACGGQADEEPMTESTEAGTLQVTDVTANMSLPTTTGAIYMLISNNSDDLLGDWYTVDVKLNKRFHLGKYVLQGTLECNNLTDSHHEVVKRYPMPGRNYKMTLKFEM